MTSVLQSSRSTEHTGHLDLVLEPPKDDLDTRHLVHSPDSLTFTLHNSSTDMFNIVHRSPASASTNGIFVDNLPSQLSRSHPAIHFDHVATHRGHDAGAWTREQKLHDTKLNAVAIPFSPGSNGITPYDCTFVNAARNSFALMEFRTQELRTVEQLSNATRLREDTAACPHEWTSLIAPALGAPPVQPVIVAGPFPREVLSEGSRRVGETLVRCGVINAPGISPLESIIAGRADTSGTHLVNAPVISSTATLPFDENDVLLITALANWASEWVHTLVIQPYLQGRFRFQYQGRPSKASTSVALRIRRVLSDVCNPVQVVIHALWFIGILTGNGAHDNAPPLSPFFSVPIFRYLHNNGTFIAEDFMFRTFITCAIISDKTVNDAALSTDAWNRLTYIPHAILNATEKYALSCLKWDVVMTRIQWQDTIIYLRSCIKMGSVFDSFAYDETSSSGIMARYLDELIDLSYVDNTYTSQQGVLAMEILAPQPIRHPMHWGIFNAAEWCPKDDPVINQRPQTIGIAPGADQNSNTPKVGMTTKDLLDSILGSSNVPGFAHVTRPTSTSFCGSFGAIGVRFAHTVRIASACQNAPWFPSMASP